ncbi:hypothetical protein SRO_3779 [Streptomyces rochei]|nr:hypothetical protein SRO_3779 [Streptomyces rochei]
MKVRKATLLGISLVAAASCCTAFSPAQGPQAGSAGSALRCYATHRDPDTPICYRSSWKAEYRHGDVVYVPILIQVPMPAHPPSVTIVGSLNDVHPSGA